MKTIEEVFWEPYVNHPCSEMRRMAARELGRLWAKFALAEMRRRIARGSRTKG